MKKKLYLFTIITFFLTYCTKQEEQNITKEIEKIETAYKEGDTKIETFLQPGENKIETFASEEVKDQIRRTLEKNNSKKTTYLKAFSRLAGVIANGSCGTFSTIEIFMDCEDTRNSSSTGGWTGSCGLPGGRNAYLKFCIVDAYYFTHIIGINYAILHLGGNIPGGVSAIVRYFDNEDDDNINWAYLDGKEIPKGTWYGQSWFEYNTRMGFLYYPSVNAFGNSSFPNLGISYGVFGSIGANRGYIHTDDEDSRNSNWCFKYVYNKNNGTYTKTDINDQTTIDNIIQVGGNTTLYMSKIY
ncbi:MAG: hypothetical protein N2662_00095 [Bacteroidales bacterium]|nr:hypothetical protein [Bacteroidales bacterium]